MNASRRKELAAIAEALNDVRYRLELVADAERDAFDSLPESLQEGERGQGMEEAADALSEIVSTLETAVAEIEEAAS